jgi:hypothetical protein
MVGLYKDFKAAIIITMLYQVRVNSWNEWKAEVVSKDTETIKRTEWKILELKNEWE